MGLGISPNIAPRTTNSPLTIRAAQRSTRAAMNTTDENRGAKSITAKPMTSPTRSALFGPRPLLKNEDVQGYDELYAHVHLAVEPANFIDEMLVDDAVAHEWGVLRWRRLAVSLMRPYLPQALRKFLIPN